MSGIAKGRKKSISASEFSNLSQHLESEIARIELLLAGPVIECSSDAEPNMLVYIDAEGVARPAKSDSIETMPAQFFVASKVTDTTCTVSTTATKTLEGETLTFHKRLFVSETEAGMVQSTPPTEPGTVIQIVSSVLSQNSLHYSITDNITLRS